MPLPPTPANTRRSNGGWVYSQSTGELTHNGQQAATGYRGAGPGRNNPALQSSQGQGPIPQGTYTIGTAHQGTHTGPVTLNLDAQAGTQTFGRDLFRVHGDSVAHPGTASEGCIIMPRAVRQQMATSPDRTHGCSMMRRLCPPAWLAILWHASAAAAPAISPALVSARIDRTGARATIVMLEKSQQWDGVVTRIGGGSDAWLAVAAKLAPGSDAGSAEDLGIGLATALPHNATGVLRVVTLSRSPIGLDHVCGIPFIEQPREQAALYLKRAVAAVGRAHDPALADRRARCLNALRG